MISIHQRIPPKINGFYQKMKQHKRFQHWLISYNFNINYNYLYYKFYKYILNSKSAY